MQLNDALKKVSEFLHGLQILDEQIDFTQRFIQFSESETSSIRLTGHEADAYALCLENCLLSRICGCVSAPVGDRGCAEEPISPLGGFGTRTISSSPV